MAKFKISIDDGFCEYQYEVEVSEMYSIDKMIENICWVLAAEKTKVKLIRGVGDHEKIIE